MSSTQRKASTRLKAELNMFKLLADSSPQGIIIFQDDKVIYVNATLGGLTGYSLRTMSNWQIKDFMERVVEEDQKEALRRYNKLSKGQVPSGRSELRFRPKKGPIRWIDVVGTISQVEGKLILQVTVMDITERKQAEAALRLSEARYRNLFDSVPVGLYRTTPDGRNLDVNTALVQLLGVMKRESLLAINADEFYVVPKARKQWQALMEREGVVRGFEVEFRRHDGQLIWVRDNARAVRDAEGRVLFYEGSLEDITEQKRAEKALQESETKFRTMVENSLQGLVIFQDFQIVYANQAFADFCGYSIKELLSLSPEQVAASVHPEDQAMVWGRMRDRLAGKPVPSHYEFRAIRKDGAIPWGELYSTKIEYKGKPALQVAVVDITDRKLAEQALRESEERIRLILDSLSTGVVLIDAETQQIISANPAAIEMIRASKDKIEGQTCHKYICPAEEGNCPITDLKQEVDHSERVLLTAQGEELPILKTVIQLKLGNREVLMESFTDITSLKQAEHALLESKEKFRVLVEEISDWVWEMDAQGKFTYSNNAVEDILGYSAGQMLGCTPFDFLHPDEMTTTLQAYIGSFKDKKPFRDIVSRFLHRDGSTIIMEARGRPILDEQGNLNGYRGIYRDITDRLRMIEKLRELSEHL